MTHRQSCPARMVAITGSWPGRNELSPNRDRNGCSGGMAGLDIGANPTNVIIRIRAACERVVGPGSEGLQSPVQCHSERSEESPRLCTSSWHNGILRCAQNDVLRRMEFSVVPRPHLLDLFQRASLGFWNPEQHIEQVHQGRAAETPERAAVIQVLLHQRVDEIAEIGNKP
jgi:hypothetical protein